MQLNVDLTGKTAIITGSNSGIGLGVAHELARSGASVIINSFTDDEADHAIAADISGKYGVESRYISADMSRPDQCRKLVERAGGCDILENHMTLK